MKRTLGVYTLGCKTNQYDAQAMQELFEVAGYGVRPFSDKCDVYLIVTCTVTATADQKSLKAIRQAAKRNPGAAIIVAGCLAQRDAKGVFLPGVRLIIGTRGRNDVVQLLEKALQEDRAISAGQDLSDAPFEPLSVQSRHERTRAYIKIQEGCENRCAYCIIPTVRGAVRSRPLEEITREAQALRSAGYKEVVVTGIHIASYGKDLQGADLLCALSAIDRAGFDRIRLGSLEPGWVNEEAAKALADMPSIARQFHLSLQSGSEEVLRRMRRRYTPQRFLQSAQFLRAAMPGCAITTDVICGFPGESEEDFAKTLALCEAAAFSRIHAFCFSEREGTDAARMPHSVPMYTRQQRTRDLIALGERLEGMYIQNLIGQKVDVLFEKSDEGYCGQYVRVCAPGGVPGEMGRVEVTAINGNTALGRIV